jgi:lipid A 3-O-deacylase
VAAVLLGWALLGEAGAARAADAAQPLGGFISEIKLGISHHDTGVFGESVEEGADIGGEVLFVSPDVLSLVWSPRPHLGVHVNTAGDTSQLYGGLTWEFTLWRGLFVAASFGFSVHDGEAGGNTGKPDKQGLGTRFLFRESLELGWRFDGGTHSLSVMLDHISNAGLSDDNDGLDTLGVRYGYRF